jgi:trehalose 6-phosphate synthase/phosphatase
VIITGNFPVFELPPMQRLLIVSNRLPVNLIPDDGSYSIQPSVGGLSTGLGSFYSMYDCTWIGWSGIPSEQLDDEQREAIDASLGEIACCPVHLPEDEIEHYYEGFCNSTIWPLFHYFRSLCSWDTRTWEAYRAVNRRFCDAVVSQYREGDTIWVHDYHLMLLPEMIRERIPDAAIGFFLHIPFPSHELYRMLPWREEILRGLLGADLVGFHTYDYVRHFLNSVRRLVGYEHTYGEIKAGTRLIRADTFPMGIDYDRFAESVNEPTIQQEIRQIRQKYADQKILLSFDRLDYTKGIPERLKAFDAFLKKHPEWQDRVTMIVVAVPSRTTVTQYQSLKKEVDELIGNIVGRYGTMDWTPIRYFYDVLPFQKLVAFYHTADIAVVTPLRDGMNLMAKEYLATKEDGQGVLILSEMAGASMELGEAVTVNPFDEDGIVQAMETALTMPVQEQIERNRGMQHRLQRYHVRRWAEDFLQRLTAVRKRQMELEARILSQNLRFRLIREYQESERRLILLDYDGTLVPFVTRPERAAPDSELTTIMRNLTSIPENEVVIISGRDKETLERWFGGFDVGLIAEHGIWIRERGSSWEMIEELNDEWKEEVLPILERFVERTPGTFVEIKNYSLVWHYRKAEPELGATRAIELKDTLIDFIANRGIDILEGNKVIEVKNVSINKGRAASHWVAGADWDFILALGDDWTDEYLFEALPANAYSIKVGLEPSKARFSMLSLDQVRYLLSECATFGRHRKILTAS